MLSKNHAKRQQKKLIFIIIELLIRLDKFWICILTLAFTFVTIILKGYGLLPYLDSNIDKLLLFVLVSLLYPYIKSPRAGGPNRYG